MVAEPKVNLRVVHHHSPFSVFLARFNNLPFWPILARLMDYYSSFWGSRVIVKVAEPYGALTRRSSTLAVLADSNPFHGLQLIVLAPGAISTINNPAFTCSLPKLTVSADSGPFRGLLLAILGPGVIFMVAEPQGALMCRSSSLPVLGDSGPFHGLLLTVLGSQSDFHN